ATGDTRPRSRAVAPCLPAEPALADAGGALSDTDRPADGGDGGVKPGAQKTDGYQISQSLLLDDDSQFLAKPELEIYADDVACSHGSTSGAIDDEALFYLRSRGVAADEATNLLTLAFLSEALSEVENEDIAELINARLEGWLKRRR
ncbi:MAG: SufD family Fe-S cluster assembly protein, partial [Paracoccaceae bacterium]